ncbi:extracellular calcium-sensing receptor-like [Pelodytes ibericus]
MDCHTGSFPSSYMIFQSCQVPTSRPAVKLLLSVLALCIASSRPVTQDSASACNLQIKGSWEDYGYYQDGDVIIGAVLTVSSVGVDLSFEQNPQNQIMCLAKLVGFIGDHYSSTTIPIAQIVGVYGYTQISYGASDFSLSDKRVYPHLFRMIQNDHVYCSLVAKLIHYFSWNWIGILTSDDASGEEETTILTKCITSRTQRNMFYFKIYGFPDKNCTGKERLINIKEYMIRGITPRIARAIETMAIALNSVHLTNAHSDGKINSYTYKQELHRFVKTMKYNFYSNNTVYLFDEHGEFNFYYLVVNWLENPIGVGNYTPWAPEDQQLMIDTKAISWKTKDNKIPKSQCSENCLPGYRKVSTTHTCCYDCVQCSVGEISNVTDSENCIKCLENEWPNEKKDRCIPKLEEFLSYTDILAVVFVSMLIMFCLVTLVILALFASYKNTPIVKANNRNLSFILLVSIMLSFLCVFLFLGRPVDITCMLRQVSFGVIFSVAVSSVLAKTIMVYIAFKATKPGSICKKWLGVKLPNYLVSFFSFLQVIISISWLATSPPFQEQDTHSYQRNIVIQCNEGSIFAFYSVLGYMGLLAAVSFIIAFLARNLPDSFNEAKYITFSMLVFCSVWIAMIPAYLSTKGKYMVAVEVFAILTSSAGLLGCIFFPKCYMILFRPEMNTKTYMLSNRNPFQDGVKFDPEPTLFPEVRPSPLNPNIQVSAQLYIGENMKLCESTVKGLSSSGHQWSLQDSVSPFRISAEVERALRNLACIVMGLP